MVWYGCGTAIFLFVLYASIKAFEEKIKNYIKLEIYRMRKDDIIEKEGFSEVANLNLYTCFYKINELYKRVNVLTSISTGIRNDLSEVKKEINAVEGKLNSVSDKMEGRYWEFEEISTGILKCTSSIKSDIDDIFYDMKLSKQLVEGLSNKLENYSKEVRDVNEKILEFETKGEEISVKEVSSEVDFLLEKYKEGVSEKGEMMRKQADEDEYNNSYDPDIEYRGEGAIIEWICSGNRDFTVWLHNPGSGYRVNDVLACRAGGGGMFNDKITPCPYMYILVKGVCSDGKIICFEFYAWKPRVLFPEHQETRKSKNKSPTVFPKSMAHLEYIGIKKKYRNDIIIWTKCNKGEATLYCVEGPITEWKRNSCYKGTSAWASYD